MLERYFLAFLHSLNTYYGGPLTMPGAGNAAAVPHKSRIATTDWQDSAIRNYLIKIAIIVIKAKYNVLGEPIRVSKCV
jgi:hypothetical protein